MDIKEILTRMSLSTINFWYRRVYVFNFDGGQPLGQSWLTTPKFDKEMSMIQEEVDELKMAVQGLKKVKENGETKWIEAKLSERRLEVADAIGDIIYVTAGLAAKLGMDLPSILHEVALSNETKYNENGLLLVVDGKIQKGPNFKAPNLEFVNEVIPFDKEIEEIRKDEQRTDEAQSKSEVSD